MKKYGVGLLVAYGLAMTLLAAHWATEAYVYHHFFDLLMRGKHGHVVEFPSFEAIYDDFGIDLPLWTRLCLEFATLRSRVLVPVIFAIVVAGLAVPACTARRAAQRDRVEPR